MENVKSNSQGETFSGMFQFQGGIFYNALDGLNDEDALKRVLDRSNHSNWLLGHILHCRFMLADMLGAPSANPYGQTYWERLTEGKYPPLPDLNSHFSSISEKLIERLSQLTDHELDVKPKADRPSLSEVISFFIYHEAYHIGQLGLIRKLIGLDTLKSN